MALLESLNHLIFKHLDFTGLRNLSQVCKFLNLQLRDIILNHMREVIDILVTLHSSFINIGKVIEFARKNHYEIFKYFKNLILNFYVDLNDKIWEKLEKVKFLDSELVELRCLKQLVIMSEKRRIIFIILKIDKINCKDYYVYLNNYGNELSIRCTGNNFTNNRRYLYVTYKNCETDSYRKFYESFNKKLIYFRKTNLNPCDYNVPVLIQKIMYLFHNKILNGYTPSFKYKISHFYCMSVSGMNFNIPEGLDNINEKYTESVILPDPDEILKLIPNFF